MRIRLLYLFALLLVFLTTALFGESGPIPIAFLPLEPRGDLPPELDQIVTEMLEAEIHATGTFELIERKELETLLDTQSEQFTGFVDATSDQMIEMGKIAAVRLLLMGSIGRIDDRTVVTVRLVDAQTAQIIFANTIVSDPNDQIEDSLRVLARKIRENGLQTIADPSLENIKQAREAGNLREALLYARKLMESDPTPENVRLVEELKEETAEEIYKQGRRDLRNKYWDNAVVLADEAILLDPQPRYFEFRFKALAVRDEALRREAVERERLQRKEQERRDKEAAGLYTTGDHIRNYYQGIKPGGYRLGYVSGVILDNDQSVSNAFASNGGEFSYVHPTRNSPSWVTMAWSLGAAMNVQDSGFGDKDIGFQLRGSPFTTVMFGIGNFYFIPSLEIGTLLITGPTTGNVGGLTGAVQGAVELKLWRSIGFYTTVRIQYEWMIGREELSGVHPSWSVGIVL